MPIEPLARDSYSGSVSPVRHCSATCGGLKGKSRRTQDRKYICRELVNYCYDQIGVPFKLRDEYLSPDDIWLDDQAQLQYRIM
jgi:hypothetical protein